MNTETYFCLLERKCFLADIHNEAYYRCTQAMEKYKLKCYKKFPAVIDKIICWPFKLKFLCKLHKCILMGLKYFTAIFTSFIFTEKNDHIVIPSFVQVLSTNLINCDDVPPIPGEFGSLFTNLKNIILELPSQLKAKFEYHVWDHSFKVKFSI